MNINIEDITKGSCTRATYLASFPAAEHPPFIFYKYPVDIDPLNAEKMLHVLNAMCHHPHVYGYFKARIPSPFFPENKVRNRQIPLQPLLTYLAGPSNLFRLDWKEDHVQYIKETKGLSIQHYSRDFIFPYNNGFTNAFIECFGEKQWTAAGNRQELTDWDFCMADKNASSFLSPYETYFISSHGYLKVCNDLQNICLELETILSESIFNWTNHHPEENMLVNIIIEKTGFNY